LNNCQFSQKNLLKSFFGATFEFLPLNIIENYQKLSKITPEIIVIVKKICYRTIITTPTIAFAPEFVPRGNRKLSKIIENYRKLRQKLSLSLKKICYHSTIITTPNIAFAPEFVP
jgi:hypothetical protein